MERLSLSTLGQVPGPLRPLVDPREVTAGVAHLGVGAFTRAHQAVVLERAMAATGSTDWGMVGVSQRSSAASDALSAQEGLYTVSEIEDNGPGGPRVVGALRGAVFAGKAPSAVVDRIAHPATRMITVTVTEKGYCCAPGGWDLDLEHPGIRADLAGRPPRTVVGMIAAGLARRRHEDAPLDVLSCDNLPHNGAVLRDLVMTFLDRSGDSPTRAWVQDKVRFPSSMVDRMVPATTAATRAHAASGLGLHDACAVAGEPFLQWVIEDDFAGAPPLAAGGATLTHDVQPWERLKLRVLNASHSVLAWHGALRGLPEIAVAVAHPPLGPLVESLVLVDIVRVVSPPTGVTVTGYLEQVLRRCGNRGLHHRTLQVASDGTAKVGPRLLEPAAEALAAGHVPEGIASGVAAWWLVTTRDTDFTGRPLSVEDPTADRLLTDRPSLDVALARLAPRLADHPDFVRCVEASLEQMGREAGVTP
jgi:fructuronate reductase